MEENIEHRIDILNIVQERDFNKETCEDSYIEAVLLGIETVLKELKKLQKENEELKTKADFKMYICGMRNGKELLQKTLQDYEDLSTKTLKLQSITGYTLDNLIDLFLEGYNLKKDSIPKSKIE